MVIKESEGDYFLLYDSTPLPTRIGLRDILSKYRGEKRNQVRNTLKGVELWTVPSEKFQDTFYLLNRTNYIPQKVILISCLQNINHHEMNIILSSTRRRKGFDIEQIDKRSIAFKLECTNRIYLPTDGETEFVVCVIDVENFKIEFQEFIDALRGYEQWEQIIAQLPRIAFQVVWQARKGRFLIDSSSIEYYPRIGSIYTTVW